MEAKVKRYIMGLMMTGGHRHAEMSDTLKCGTCGTNFKKAESEYNRLRRQSPELFKRARPAYPDSPEFLEKLQMLNDRLKRDRLYRKHIELSLHGTPAEKMRETRRANSGYYTRHGDYQGIRYF